MTVTVELEGFKELEAELAKMKNPTARGVGRRAMRKALKPVEDTANAFWPGADDRAFITSSRIKSTQRQEPESRTLINMFTGSPAPHAHLLEFGTGPRTQTTTGRFTGQVSPRPMLQPAWDMNKDKMLAELRRILGDEIRKTFARIGRKPNRAQGGSFRSVRGSTALTSAFTSIRGL